MHIFTFVTRHDGLAPLPRAGCVIEYTVWCIDVLQNVHSEPSYDIVLSHRLHGRSGPGAEPGAAADLESLRYNGRYRMPPRAGPGAVANATPGPGPERYFYSYSHRNIRFVSISTEHDLSPGSEQYMWLEAELAAADTPAARARQPWLLLFGHKPPVCSHAEV